MNKETLLGTAMIAGLVGGVLAGADMAPNLYKLCLVVCLVCGGAGLATRD